MIYPDAATATLNLETPNSTAVSRIVWHGRCTTPGAMLVTYRNGGTYSFTDVMLTDLQPVLDAADSHVSVGSALHTVIGTRKGIRVPV